MVCWFYEPCRGEQSMRLPTQIIVGCMLICAGGAGSASAAGSPPEFAPNPSVGWVASGARYLPPDSGAGPVGPAPGQRLSSNNELRATGAQPLFAIGDQNAPILQPWARDRVRQRNERVLAGKPAFSRQASCWPAGTPGFLTYAVQPVYFVQTEKEVLLIWQADHQLRHVLQSPPTHSIRSLPPRWLAQFSRRAAPRIPTGCLAPKAPCRSRRRKSRIFNSAGKCGCCWIKAAWRCTWPNQDNASHFRPL